MTSSISSGLVTANANNISSSASLASMPGLSAYLGMRSHVVGHMGMGFGMGLGMSNLRTTSIDADDDELVAADVAMNNAAAAVPGNGSGAGNGSGSGCSASAAHYLRYSSNYRSAAAAQASQAAHPHVNSNSNSNNGHGHAPITSSISSSSSSASFYNRLLLLDNSSGDAVVGGNGGGSSNISSSGGASSGTNGLLDKHELDALPQAATKSAGDGFSHSNSPTANSGAGATGSRDNDGPSSSNSSHLYQNLLRSSSGETPAGSSSAGNNCDYRHENNQVRKYNPSNGVQVLTNLYINFQNGLEDSPRRHSSMDQLIGLLENMGKSPRTRSLSDGGTQDDDEGECM